MSAVTEALSFNLYCTPGSAVVNLFLDSLQMEYERYLEESSPCRQHQLKTTQAAQRKVQAPHSLQ